MSERRDERFTTNPPPGSVVFLIGMRINKIWKVHRWLPVFAAMPRMLNELRARPELGFKVARTFLSGRTILVVQYWESADHLTRYARAADHLHLPAWKTFNRRVGVGGDVGIFHETVVVGERAFEAVYSNMPPAMAAAAFGHAPLRRGRQSASSRLDPSVADRPAVEPPRPQGTTAA